MSETPTETEVPVERVSAAGGLASRVGRRIIRRPRRWLDAPWPAERIVRYITALIVVGSSTFAVLQVVHLDLVFQNNTPTGGDMGAHVMGPAFLRDHLLPDFRLNGWSNYWYSGFPMYRFYMVIPALMIVALNIVLPYGVAMKIVVVLGLITLPFCCWCFGRLANFKYPVPELMALAGMIFLFDESFSIYGGNVKSTMAGEFSFSIALSLGILGLGLFARGLQTGQYRSWAAIVLALSMLSHGIVLIFVGTGMVLMWLVWMDRTRFRYGAAVIGTSILLSAFWVVPFLFNHAYMTDMKYGFRPNGPDDSFWDMFFPWATFLDVLVTGFAIVGFIASVARRQLIGAWLGICCLALVAGVFVTRDSLPIIGLLWNPRLLPFLYLVRLLLMMVGIVEFAELVQRGARGVRGVTDRQLLLLRAGTATVVFVTVLFMTLFLFREVPGAQLVSKHGKTVYAWNVLGFDPVTLSPTSSDALSDAWTRYNFLGYEGKPAYGEYKALVDQMAALGADSEYGCGRALWENNKENGAYGTTMALMLLPHWTDGCIASQEGLFFEASGTTPYHFLTAAAMSANSSNPVRELRYTDNRANVGVPYMQTLGVKYLMVFTDAAKREADAHVDLSLIATSGPWNIYEVAGSQLVEGLEVEPVVVNRRDGDQRERNLELGTSWFQNRQEWAAMPADDGPASWQRIDVGVDLTRRIGNEVGDPGRKVDIVQPSTPIEVRNLPEVAVSNIEMGEGDLSFTVDKIGVPVLVKMSYFPNWNVEGAEGPYRIAPNLMVVVPTSTEVTMSYGRVPLDYIATLLTVGGIALLIFFRRRGDVVHATADPFGVPFSAIGGGAAGPGDAGNDGSTVEPQAIPEPDAAGEWAPEWDDLPDEVELADPEWQDVDEASENPTATPNPPIV
jgi:hypothetical protein